MISSHNNRIICLILRTHIHILFVGRLICVPGVYSRRADIKPLNIQPRLTCISLYNYLLHSIDPLYYVIFKFPFYTWDGSLSFCSYVHQLWGPVGNISPCQSIKNSRSSNPWVFYFLFFVNSKHLCPYRVIIQQKTYFW